MAFRNTHMLSNPWACFTRDVESLPWSFHLENFLRSFLLLSMHVLGVWLAALGVPISFLFSFSFVGVRFLFSFFFGANCPSFFPVLAF